MGNFVIKNGYFTHGFKYWDLLGSGTQPEIIVNGAPDGNNMVKIPIGAGLRQTILNPTHGKTYKIGLWAGGDAVEKARIYMGGQYFYLASMSGNNGYYVFDTQPISVNTLFFTINNQEYQDPEKYLFVASIIVTENQ